MNIVISRVTLWLAERKKAIAALLAPLAVAAFARYAIDVDVDTASTLIAALITSAAVHQTSNLTK